jgi:hypothetical protein
MTVARAQLVDVNVTRWYHVVSRTSREARLVGEGQNDRRRWIEDRLQELTRAFAVETAAFAVLENQVRVLVRLSPERVGAWSDEDVVRRWASVHPPRSSARQPSELAPVWIEQQLADAQAVAQMRQRLADLAWFMKSLREPISRRANRADDCRGAFWQSRYKSIAILDDKALLATCVYIDLSPVAAGASSIAKESPYTSLHARWKHGSADHWLCPLDAELARGVDRIGVLDGLALDGYSELVDWTASHVVQGTPRPSDPAIAVLDRWGIGSEIWLSTLRKLFSRAKPLGVAFAFDRQRLREAAKQRGCHHLANINGCPA